MRFAWSTEPSYAATPVGLNEAKAQLRIDLSDTSHDVIVGAKLKSANAWVARMLGLSLAPGIGDVYYDSFPAEDSPFLIPYPPLTSITHVKYTDSASTQTTLTATTDYLVDTVASPGRVVLAYSKSWPSTDLYPVNPIVIRFVCGYAAGAVPDPILEAILWLTDHLFHHPEMVLVGATTTLASVLPFGMLLALEEYGIADYGTLWAQ